MFNLEEAVRVLAHIEQHPEQHNQGVWVEHTECGATACFAGWTVLLNGHTADVGNIYGARTTKGERVSVLAAQILGLTPEQKFDLFIDAGNLAEVYARVAEYAGITEEALRKEVRKAVDG